MTEMTKSILVVDDNESVRRFIARFLSKKNSKYQIFTAEDGVQALEIIDKNHISLVISDIRMPGLSGLDLLAQLREEHPEIGVILMTGYGTSELQEYSKKLGCLKFIDKPVALESLQEFINDHLFEKDKAFTGTLHNIELTDIVQMSCMALTSMIIRIRKGFEEGVIYIQEGNIIHAECQEDSGEEAFYRIITWQGGRFETLPRGDFPEQTIDKPWEFLLMEGTRKMDEGNAEIEDADETEGIAGGATDHEVDRMPSDSGGEKSEIRILIVDDSKIMCKILSGMFAADEKITVIGTANDGEAALEQIEAAQPDLITLDVNMPVMGGDTALKHIMIKNPCPVIIVSNPGDQGIDRIIEFLLLGAVDFVSKPAGDSGMAEKQSELLSKVRVAAGAQIDKYTRVKAPKLIEDEEEKTERREAPEKLVLISAGTGGYAELIRLISLIECHPRTCIIARQQTSHDFIGRLSAYLDKRSRLRVVPVEAENLLKGGTCYLMADDGGAAVLEKSNDTPAGYSLVLNCQELLDFEGFIESVAENFSGELSLVMLSGATVTEVAGLRQFRNNGGKIIIRDLQGSVLPADLEKALVEEIVDNKAGLEVIARSLQASHAEGQLVG